METTRGVATDLRAFSPDRLVAEDPRLTLRQAAHIVDALKGGTASGRTPGPATRPAGGEGDAVPALPALIQRILDQVVATIPGAVGAVLRLADGEAVTIGPDARPTVEVPFVLETRIEGALGVVCETAGPVGDRDRRTLETIASFAATSLAAARSITETVGPVIGTEVAGPASSRLIASVLGPTLERHVHLAIAAERVRDVLGRITPVFQPVVELETGRVVGVEALTRFPADSGTTVDEWFRLAADAGMTPDLEIAALRAQFQIAVPLLPVDQFLAVNVSPSVATTAAFLEAVADAIEPARLVIEITEHAPVDDYRALTGALGPLRAAGARLAIDDAGAGFASLRHVLRLSPDFIKLDLSLVHRIDTDPVRRALATSLITFAGEVGATIVAEGIETRFELDTLVALGVRFGQGYHLGRPAAL